ncbi:MAG TPA: VanZ family protein [Frankiaceae bacterium]|nr:VanZ family protein [Frankiaceae bacterium]
MPAFLVALVASAVLLFAPSTPNESTFSGSDKVVHFLIFATLAALGRRARLPVLPLVIGLVGYAVGSELVQSLEPHRDGTPTDALADVLGVAVGGLVVPFANRVRRRT